jgi:Zn-dependent peptidase ImmA (M78 family)/DNA-binding XRE family transcriptional regulator
VTGEFNPEMLILARESRGHTQSAVARLLSVRQGTISKIESGVMLPSDELLGELCTALKYPQNFFFQKDPVYGFGSTIFYHRKRKGLPIRTLRQLHAQMNIRRNHMKRLLRSADVHARNGFIHLDVDDFSGNIEEIARATRAAWRLPIGPIRNLIDTIEENGGVVIPCDFQNRKIDAISEWTDLCPPLFFLNYHSEISGDRLRYSLAHELGHIFIHKYPVAEMEREANRFASEFLMPAREIKSYLYRLNLPKLAALKREWKVAMSALIERAHELRTITESQKYYLIVQLRRRTHSVREPPETDIPIERPSVVSKLVDAHLGSLGYTIEQMGELLGELDSNFRTMYLPAPRVTNIR